MSWVLVALLGLGAIVIAALAAWWHHDFWSKRFAIETDYHLVERIPTPDGSAVELRRLSGDRADPVPVLMVHGVAANHRNHDPWPGTSLARHLVDSGRDVWLLTLRSGRSDRTWGERVRFAAMVQHDVPVAVEEVRRRTGADKIDYVGFSMGGMLLYASLGHTLDTRHVRRAVTIGSPGAIRLPYRFLAVARWLPRALVPPLHLRFFARMAAFASEWFPATPIHSLVYNKKNVTPGSTRSALVNIIQNIPASLQADLKDFAFNGGRIAVNGVDALRTLEAVSTPALFIAGTADRIAPPQSVRAAYDAWAVRQSGVTKKFVLVGCETGAECDYGHGDLALGRHVARDVFPHVAEFLAEPDTERATDVVVTKAAQTANIPENQLAS